ncbi:MAG: hypothetical protein ABF370_05200 [Verrucomicrobiales bacterium]
MKRPPKKLPWLAALVIAIIGLLVRGEAPKEAAIPATSAAKIAEAMGKAVDVSGRVAKANVSSSGTHFLNFAGSEFKIVCLADLVKKFPAGGPAALYKGKSIVVTGVVELYKGKPQIKLTGPDQVRVIGGTPNIASSENRASAGPFKLKQTGKATWQSPIGLTYQGRDPKGLTRVEHIMLHAQDQPRRAGKHGVFDANSEAEVFALLDKAWERAQQQGVRPRNEGTRSTCTVSMGRRIGYLGGQVGGQRRNPALKTIRFVYETGTRNVVTAFPN